jgi:protein FRG1
VNDTKIALKSGFEKYLRVEKDGVIRGIADAVGSMEQWEPIFEVK